MLLICRRPTPPLSEKGYSISIWLPLSEALCQVSNLSLTKAKDVRFAIVAFQKHKDCLSEFCRVQSWTK